MASTSRLITPVKNHTEKYVTYKTHLEQYNKAINNHFFFEAILIDYACLEDRLRYALCYLGVLQSEKDFKITSLQSKRVLAIKGIVHIYKAKANLSISSIAGKRMIVAAIFESLCRDSVPPESHNVWNILQEKLNNEDKRSEMLTLLGEIETWCKYRNEIIHSLMNKNIDSLQEQVEEQAIKGHNLFRQLDGLVRWIKGRKIRKALELKEE